MKITAAWICLLMFCGSAEAALRSPWDIHPAGPAEDAYTCPAPPRPPRDLNVQSYYTDAHHSIIDTQQKAIYDQAVSRLDEFARAVVHAADRYRTANSAAAAQCVVSLLDSAAHDRALTGNMATGQAEYVQGWKLGSWAVAWLKVRGSGAATEDQARHITEWLVKLAKENRAWYELRRSRNSEDSRNNHLYWAGFAIAAAGIAADDRSLFNWGMNAYLQGVNQIKPDGSLPLEMGRAGRALHYHLYALAPLVFLAEFGEANGVDLYSANNFAFRRLVALCLAGLRDPAAFGQRVGIAQEMPPELGAGEIGWARPYLHRFPDPELEKLMNSVQSLSYTDWGGLPPD